MDGPIFEILETDIVNDDNLHVCVVSVSGAINS